MTDALERYCRTGHATVEGWLLPGAIAFTVALARAQRDRGLHGPVCEIGVHHGRLFILLALLTEGAERALAIDLFEHQDENVDGSGLGSRTHLTHNLRAHGCAVDRVDLLAANSLGLEAAALVARCGGRPRLFSIDGGHTAQATRSDLRLADAAVCDGGIVILDDYFNPAWPGVSEGTCAFMREASAGLLPVAITSNKFFLAKGADAAAAYRRTLQAAWPQAKESTVFGRPVLCHEPTPSTLRRRVTASRPWLALRATPVGRLLLQLKRHA